MPDVLIIGAGPAGISAALYTTRAGIPTTIIARDIGALNQAGWIENYYGFAQPVFGQRLAANGVEQARRLGAVIIPAEVLELTLNERFTAITTDGVYQADAVVLATGAPRREADIPGIERFEGAGVSYCALCDGFFFRGQDVAVLGCCEYALHEVELLQPLVESVTLLTNSEPPMAALPQTLPVITTRIAALEGDDRLESILFEDGTRLYVSGLFVAMGVTGNADLAIDLGAMASGNRVVVDENMATTVPGLFAAGDVIGGMQQIAESAFQGYKAGISVVMYL